MADLDKLLDLMQQTAIAALELRDERNSREVRWAARTTMLECSESLLLAVPELIAAARERDMLKALCLEAAERFGTGKRALSPYGFIGRAEDERTDLVNRLRAAGGKT